MFEKYLYKTKDSQFVLQFFLKNGFIQDINVYKNSGSIIFYYSPIYQKLLKELNIPVAKTIKTVLKTGKSNKNVEEIPYNDLLKDKPYEFSKVKENLLLEHLVGSEKEEFVNKVEKISKSRNEIITKNENTNPIISAYLLQGHCFLIEEKNNQYYLSRTEVEPNTIKVRQLGIPSNGSKSFLKNTESMIDLFNKAIKEKEYILMSEIESGQLFGLYKENDLIYIIPYDKEKDMMTLPIKLFNTNNGNLVEDNQLLNNNEFLTAKNQRESLINVKIK